MVLLKKKELFFMDIKNKTINFLGDSITEGHGATSNEKCFVSLIGERTGAIVRNYGIGGTRIARQNVADEFEKRGNFCDRMRNMEDSDVMVVFGGTNDFGHGDAPMGEFSDRDDRTFYGACHTCFSYLAEKYAGKPVFIITPLHRCGEFDKSKNKNGLLLTDYISAIKEVARYYSIPVLDLYSEYGVTPVIDSVRERFMPDGLHPSDAGHSLLADKIIAYIKTI